MLSPCQSQPKSARTSSYLPSNSLRTATKSSKKLGAAVVAAALVYGFAGLAANGGKRPLLMFDGITTVAKRSSVLAKCRRALCIEFKLQIARRRQSRPPNEAYYLHKPF